MRASKSTGKGRKKMAHGVHLLKDKKGEFYALVVARNGNTLVRTSEGYKTRAGMIGALGSSVKILFDAFIGQETGLIHDHTRVTKKSPSGTSKKVGKAVAPNESSNA